MPTPGAGALDRRIRIEFAYEGPQSPSGEATKQWALLKEVSAQKLTESGREMYAARQMVAKVTIGWRVRWSEALAALTPSDTYRVIGPDGRAYDIGDVSEEGRRAFLIITGWARAE